MSNLENDVLMEAAVWLADEMEDLFEDPTYCDRVETILKQPVPDLHELRHVVREMEIKRWQARLNDLPSIEVW